MAATLPAALQSAINSGLPPGIPVELLEIEKAAGGFERYTNHWADVTAFGQQFLSNGLWVGMSEIEHDARGISTTWSVELDLREAAIVNANYEAAIARLWHTYLDDTDQTVPTLGDPVLIGEGEVSVGDDDEQVDRIVRRLDVTSLQVDQFAPELHARTNRGHQDRYAGDDFFVDVARLRRISFRTGGAGVKPFAGG